jgi:hypothetical protein
MTLWEPIPSYGNYGRGASSIRRSLDTGAVSVYGPQTFEHLGFGITTTEYITLGNYLFYLEVVMLAWMLIDR